MSMTEPHEPRETECLNLVGSVSGVRAFLYTEHPEITINKGIFLFKFNFHDHLGNVLFQDLVDLIIPRTFQISALLNRDFYNLANQLTYGIKQYFGPKSRALLAETISHYFSCFSFTTYDNDNNNDNNTCLPVPDLVFVADLHIQHGHFRQHEYEYEYESEYVFGESHVYVDPYFIVYGYLNDLVDDNNNNNINIVDAYAARSQLMEYEDTKYNTYDLYCILRLLRWCHSRKEPIVGAEDMNFSYETRHALVAQAMANRTLVHIKSTLVFIQTEELGFGGDDDDMCSICHSTKFETEAEEITQLVECKHTFHTNCLFRWLLYNPSCPLCRFSGTSLLCSSRN